jgi:multisubunit Na+/H+ antiporter MnhB subunit
MSPASPRKVVLLEVALVVALGLAVAFAVLYFTGHPASQSAQPGGGVVINDIFSNITNGLSS